jgi:hypothetical protein
MSKPIIDKNPRNSKYFNKSILKIGSYFNKFTLSKDVFDKLDLCENSQLMFFVNKKEKSISFKKEIREDGDPRGYFPTKRHKYSYVFTSQKLYNIFIDVMAISKIMAKNGEVYFKCVQQANGSFKVSKKTMKKTI